MSQRRMSKKPYTTLSSSGVLSTFPRIPRPIRLFKSVVLVHNFLVPGDEPAKIPGLAFREVPEHAPQRAPD